jgi:hypothetical protein
VLSAVLARRCMGSAHAARAVVAVVAFACPMPLYACSLFEHVVAAACLLGALVAATGPAAGARQLALAGALFGAATCLRTELYAFAPAMALVVAWRIGVRPAAWTRWLWFGACAAAVIGIFLVAHRLATSVWHPALHASAGGEELTLDQRARHVVAPDVVPEAWIAIVATIAAAIASSLPTRGARIAARVLAVAVAVTWIVLACIAIAKVDGREVRTLLGLGTSVPVVVLGVVRGIRREDRATPTGVLAAAAVVYAAIVVLLPKASASGGLELGARYLLPVVPLLVIAATDFARRHAAFAALWIVMVAIGAWGTIVNLKAQWQIRELGAHVVTAIEESRAQAMFTEVWWVAQLAVPAQGAGVGLFYGSAPSAIYDRLYDAGVRRVVALRGSPPPPTGRVGLRRVAQHVIDDPRLAPEVYDLIDGSAR